VQLFAPAQAYRVRRDSWTDTPLPPDEPAGTNPPDGAIIDYTLPAGVSGPLTIEILDSSGRRVRTFASTDREEPLYPDMNVPAYWVRPTAIPAATAGDHRFVWDLHEAPPQSVDHGFPISAVVHATLIVVLCVTPVFFMGGLAGAFFEPLALSYLLAMLASMLVATTDSICPPGVLTSSRVSATWSKGVSPLSSATVSSSTST